MDLGDLLAHLRLDNKPFKKALMESSQEARKTFAKLEGVAKKHSRGMGKAHEDFSKKSVAASDRMAKGWWKTYGRVALGFTIAYRAMNAFENGLRQLVQLFGEAIRESGELAAYQAKLAMFYRITTSATEAFSKTFAKAAGNVRALADASVKSVTALTDLTTGFDELAQAGIIVTKKMTPMFVSLVGFTKLVAQTTGSSMRQVRQEFQALAEGHVKVTNILIRSMKRFGVLTDEDLKNLKKMVNTQEIIEKVARRVHEEWSKVRDIILSADPIMALEFWRKSVRAVAREAITLASALGDVGNIFAVIFKEHAEKFRKTFSDEDMARFVSVVRDLGRILDWVLTKFEGFIRGLLLILTVFRNVASEMLSVYRSSEWLRGTLGLLYKTFAAFIIVKATTMFLRAFGKTLIWLVKAPVKAFIGALATIHAKFLLIPALVVAAGLSIHTFFQTVLDMMPDVTKTIRGFLEDMIPSWMRAVKSFLSWLYEMSSKSATWTVELLKETAEYWGIPVEALKKLLEKLYGYIGSKARALGLLQADFLQMYVKNFKTNVGSIAELFNRVVTPIVEYLKKELAKLLLPADVERIIAGLKKVGKALELATVPPKPPKIELKAEDLMRALRLQRQMFKQLGRSRIEQAEKDADLELEIRLKLIEKLKIAEKMKNALVEMAEKVHAQKLLIIYGTFWDGMKEGYRKFVDNARTAFEQAEEAAKKTADAMTAAFSDLFFDAMKGKLKSWQDYVLAILDRILRALTDVLAQMVAVGIVRDVAAAWAGGSMKAGEEQWTMKHGGGILGRDRGPFRTVPISTFADVPRAHTGLLPSEIPVIARRDEGIFTPAQMKALGKSEGDNYNIVINAVDAKSFADLTNRNPQAILNPFKKALRSGDRELRGAIRNTV